MRVRDHQLRFGSVQIALIAFVIAALVVTGLVLYQRHRPISAMNSAATSQTQTTAQPQSKAAAQPGPTVAYLQIKEWGVKLPLSDNIKDAYYVVPLGVSKNQDGQPSGILLGLTSLNGSCGTLTNTGRGSADALGEIVRTLPSDKDPVSGKPFAQLNPGGSTIAGYYYGYTSSSKNKTCASATTLQSIDSAFGTAVKGILPAPAH